MKTTSILFAVVAAIAAAFGGYLVGRMRSSVIAPAANSNAVEAPAPSARGSKQDGSPQPSTAAASTAAAGAQASQRDLAGRIRDIAAMAASARRDYETETFFESLTLTDLAAAFQVVNNLPPGSSRSRLLGKLFGRWATLDPRAALGAAQKLPARDRILAETAALDGWAKVDPFAAWAAAKEMIAANPAQNYRMTGPLRELAKVDLPRALAEATALENETGRVNARYHILDAILDSGGMPALVHEIQALPSASEREKWMTDVFKRWGALDSEAPLAALNSISDRDLARSAMNGMLTGWAELDPAGAFAYALDNRTDALVSGALGPVLQTAVRYTSEMEIREMMAGVVAAGALDSVADAVIFPLSNSYPEFALELAGTLTDERQRMMRTSSVISMWARNNFEAAAAYYEQLPAGELKSRAFPTLTFSALQRDDGAATVVRWLDALPPTDRVRNVQMLISNAEMNRSRLRPGAAETFARAVANTPGLSPQTLERAQRAFGTLPTP